MANSANGVASQASIEVFFTPGKQFKQVCMIQAVAGAEFCIPQLCKTVPRAVQLAVVAAVNAISQQVPELFRNSSGEFDGQVRNAASGIHLIRGGNRLR